ncbi:MAG: HIT domain-containing protein [Alphaproteobacteria bacterium]|nr:HIT domain-containing protein [Alphaproteobacteria bacterium]
MQYDKNNVFYKIINKTIKTNIVLEGEHFLAFHDITPKAPVHVLVIPKGCYVDYRDFIESATDEEILDFQKGIQKVIDKMKIREGGYRLISNSGKFGQQEVMHMHVHILGKSIDD